MSDAAAKRRARQTVNNLVLSLLATIGLVVVLVLIVPRDNTNHIPAVDASAIAARASEQAPSEIVLPELPKGWWANKATWTPNPTDTVPAFTAGFIGPENQYIGETMGFAANPTWLALKLQGALETGRLGKWQIFESQEIHEPAKTMDYVMLRSLGSDYILLYGTAPTGDFEKLAASIDSRLLEVRPND